LSFVNAQRHLLIERLLDQAGIERTAACDGRVAAFVFTGSPTGAGEEADETEFKWSSKEAAHQPA
jgi:hypothetical protein